MNFKTNCKYFNWYKPCEYQKLDKTLKCNNLCKKYEKSLWKILVVKRWAIWEVLRCTSLLHKIKEKYVNYEIWWLTDYPDLLNNKYVDKKIKFSWVNLFSLLDVDFDVVYSLDKEIVCCSLVNKLNAKEKKWFRVEDFKILPIDKDAEYLWIRWIDDEFMKKDKRHYMDEIFETSWFKFNEEEYILPEYSIPYEIKEKIDTSKIVVWLNTWTSVTWKTRLWPNNYWIDLAKNLIESWYEVILLWWPEEDDKNKKIAEKSQAKYFWVYPFKEFIWIMDLTDIVVTQVTFSMHVATWLKKKVVLMNNIFNKNEYYFYNRPHKIIEPNIWCKMCYKSKFDKNCEVKNCMELIKPKNILEEVNKLKNE